MDFCTATLHQANHQKFEIALLPWGALEPHNFHLPYYTDCLLAQAIAREAIEKSGIKAALLPPLFLGQQNPAQCDYPCCIHTRTETQKHILTDIVRSLQHQGINKLLIINGHGGNSFKGYVRDLMFDFPGFQLFVCDWFNVVARKGFFEEEGEHADELETSTLMHYYPALVNLGQAGEGVSRPFSADTLNHKVAWTPRNWKSTTDDTGIGNPLKSTAAKGAQFAAATTNQIATLLQEICAQ